MRFGFAMPGRGPLARPDVLLKLTPQDLRGQLVMMERFAEEVRPKTLRSPRAQSRTGYGSGSGAKRLSA